MRKFKPAPKQASANRIRERYLHQLGLQRGSGGASSWDNNHHYHAPNHVVVISGLPSLPEDRATNDNVLESHDFAGETGSFIEPSDGHHCNPNMGKPIAIGPPPQLLQQHYHNGDSSHCSRSTLSTSPHNTHQGGNQNHGALAGESMTSMALACPHSLIKSDHNNNSGGGGSTLPFNLSWGTSQLSRSAAVLLNEATGGLQQQQPLRGRATTDDSVSTAVTASTAESSFTATMVSRDWSTAPPPPHATANTTSNNNIVTIPHHPPSGTASVSSMGDSVTSAPTPAGVFFQPRTSFTNNNNNCVPSSSALTSALHRFNIDSDCEASVASNSIMEDPTLMMDECHLTDNDGASSVTSRTSHVSSSGGSTSNKHPPHHHHRSSLTKKKKIGKNQRLLDRATAQERMMIMRNNDRSSKLRAGRGMPVPLPLGGGGGTTWSCSGGSSVVSQSSSSLTLMHVDHQATSSTPVAAMCTKGSSNQESFSIFLRGCIHLFPPNSSDRVLLMRSALQECCGKGFLNEKIWDRFCNSSSEEEVRKFLSSVEKDDASFAALPGDWSRNNDVP